MLWVLAVMVSQVVPSRDASTRKPSSVPPPPAVEGVQVSVTDPTPPVTTKLVGAPATVAGVPLPITPGPVPAAFIPLTRTK